MSRTDWRVWLAWLASSRRHGVSLTKCNKQTQSLGSSGSVGLVRTLQKKPELQAAILTPSNTADMLVLEKVPDPRPVVRTSHDM